MLPRLGAEESMVEASRFAVGAAIRRDAVKGIAEEWRRRAQSRLQVRQKASPEDIASMGLGYQIVEPKH